MGSKGLGDGEEAGRERADALLLHLLAGEECLRGRGDLDGHTGSVGEQNNGNCYITQF